MKDHVPKQAKQAKQAKIAIVAHTTQPGYFPFVANRTRDAPAIIDMTLN